MHVRYWTEADGDEDGTYEPAPEEMEAHKIVMDLHAKWMAADGRCVCGNRISFQDAYDYGRCWDCLFTDSMLAQEGW